MQKRRQPTGPKTDTDILFVGEDEDEKQPHLSLDQLLRLQDEKLLILERAKKDVYKINKRIAEYHPDALLQPSLIPMLRPRDLSAYISTNSVMQKWWKPNDAGANFRYNMVSAVPDDDGAHGSYVAGHVYPPDASVRSARVTVSPNRRFDNEWAVPAPRATTVELALLQYSDITYSMRNLRLPRTTNTLSIHTNGPCVAGGGMRDLVMPPCVSSLTWGQDSFEQIEDETDADPIADLKANQPNITVSVTHVTLVNAARFFYTLPDDEIPDEMQEQMPTNVKRVTLDVAPLFDQDVLVFPSSVKQMSMTWYDETAGDGDEPDIDEDSNDDDYAFMVYWPPQLGSLHMQSYFKFSTPADTPTFPETLTRLVLGSGYMRTVDVDSMLRDIGALTNLKELVFHGEIQNQPTLGRGYHTLARVQWPPTLKSIQFVASQDIAGLRKSAAEHIFIGTERAHFRSRT